MGGGLAEHTGIDVLLFRVGFAVLTLAAGAGVVLYAALWLLLPDADGLPGPLRRWVDNRSDSRLRDVLLWAVGLVIALAVLGSWFSDGGVLVLVAIALIAYLWWRERRARELPVPDAVPHDASPPVTAVALADRVARPGRPRSRLGAVTVSVMLLTLGVLAVADSSTDLSVSTAAYLGTALGVVGVGLLVGAVFGRSRGLIFLGVLLLAVLLPVSLLQIDLRGGVGQELWSADAVEDLQPVYRMGVGHGRLDLTGLDFSSRVARTRVTLNTGYAEIVLPPDVDVTVVSTVREGRIDMFESTQDGSDLRRTVTDTGADGPGGGLLELAVDVNLGYVEVTRER